MKFTVIVSLFVIALIVSVQPASAQYCQDLGGEMIGGVYFPNAQPGRWDRGGYQNYCTPRDYIRSSRYFDGYGLLDWLPMAGMVGGGVWGRGGQPVLYSDGQPLTKGQRIERAIGITAIATSIGAAIGGGKGAAIGAGIGGGGALILDSATSRGQRSNQVPSQPQASSEAQANPPPATPPQTQVQWRPVSQIRYAVVNPWPVDAIVYYDSNPAERWVARRNSSYLQIPRREGTLMAVVTTTATGGFEDLNLVVKGDGKKFVIPQP